MSHKKPNLSKGFTLVEIAVVIAIMAVLVAVLAPALLRNVEDSRAQKDESAMNEVAHAVKLAMSDAEVFDEVCSYAIANNYITYTDSSGVYGTQYADEEFWAPDGSGRAVTITFNPEENGTYVLEHGLVNDMTYGNGSVADSRTADNLQQCYLSEMGDGKLYAKLKSTIGTAIEETSSTYKNSSYTVFITIETIGDMKHAECYGLFNGTNLSPDCPASIGSGTSEYTDQGEAKPTKSQGGTTQAQFSNTDLGGGGSATPSYKSEDAYVNGLEEKYEFKYYTKLRTAVSDLNANHIGASADTNNKDDAEAGLYVDENGLNTIILLNDVNETENLVLNVKTAIDLNGHKWYTTSNKALEVTADLIIIGNGGTIEVNTQSTGGTACVYTKTDNVNMTITGGHYINSSPESDYATESQAAFGIRAFNLNADNIRVKVHTGKLARARAVQTSGQLTIRNSDIRSFQSHDPNDSTNCSNAFGVGSYGQTTKNVIYNCNITSSWYAVGGWIDEMIGGTYSTYGQNVFLSGSSTRVTRIENITMTDKCQWPADCYYYWYNSHNILQFGGTSAPVGQTIILNNCVLDGSAKKTNAIRLQSAYGERECTLKMSNTTIYVKPEIDKFIINYESQGHKVYIGQGCNFTVDNTHYPNAAWQTNEKY